MDLEDLLLETHLGGVLACRLVRRTHSRSPLRSQLKTSQQSFPLNVSSCKMSVSTVQFPDGQLELINLKPDSVNPETLSSLRRKTRGRCCLLQLFWCFLKETTSVTLRRPKALLQMVWGRSGRGSVLALFGGVSYLG